MNSRPTMTSILSNAKLHMITNHIYSQPQYITSTLRTPKYEYRSRYLETYINRNLVSLGSSVGSDYRRS